MVSQHWTGGWLHRKAFVPVKTTPFLHLLLVTVSHADTVAMGPETPQTVTLQISRVTGLKACLPAGSLQVDPVA
jgi:hypothetical protein